MLQPGLSFGGACRGNLRGWRAVFIFASLLFLGSFPLRAATIGEAQQLFLAGNYRACITSAEQSLLTEPDHAQWQSLLAQSLLAVGEYPRALGVVSNALARGSRSLPLRWTARSVFLANGDTAKAAEMAEDVVRLFTSGTASYRTPEDLVTFGRAALLLPSTDPKLVIDRVYATARQLAPTNRESYLANGELALEKHDYAMASRQFQAGLRIFPGDPEMNFGLARAYAASRPSLLAAALDATLQKNSNHVGGLLLVADHGIDAEDYAEAEKVLAQVLRVNPWQPEAWAYRSVIAHLQNQPREERSARETALKFWLANPRVPHLIGLKLSQKYRFAEGAALQRQALEFDKNYLPAKSQLAQDLLRLAEESEGWRLADQVQKQDGYDVTANNLMKLHDAMLKYRTLTNDHFTVRMTQHEAALYGSRVMELLEQARTTICAKYGYELTNNVLVEIFDNQGDFAVRTFGMPGNDGFLGVCFGPLITANSAATRPGHPFNWESMLWHEFTHVVTLSLTHNKMPRWLSEGISVYEERQANPSWGEHLNPSYREMMLGDELTPVSKLSGAFLSPKSEKHLQFAYYESSLVVEFLIERYGAPKLADMLRELAGGLTVNEAIEKHAAPMATVEADFEKFAHEVAAKMAPGLNWEKPDFTALLPGTVEIAREAWVKGHPTNFYVMIEQAAGFLQDKKLAEARTVLQQLVTLYPGFTGPESTYRRLAAVHRELGETNEERRVLSQLAERDDAASDVYQRLMELAAQAMDWPDSLLNARRYLAVNPLLPAPYRFLAQASEALDQPKPAVEAYRALLQLDPVNPAEVYFKLGRQLHRLGEPTAKRHVLQALEEAPRYPEALKLLLEMEGNQTASAAGAVTPEATSR